MAKLGGYMYAIAFDLNTEILRANYQNDSYNNAYGDIAKFLQERGFTHPQGSLYFGDAERVNAVTCVLAVQEMARTFAWFVPSVTDIRMLRIEDNNDLNIAIRGLT